MIRGGLQMNILVIGNGFDLAHGLPTKYTDFLEFCRMINAIYNVQNFYIPCNELWDDLKINVSSHEADMKNLFEVLYEQRKDASKEYRVTHIENATTELCWNEFYEHIGEKEGYRNLWITYFGEQVKYAKDNWIDFESEISNVIRLLEESMNNLSGIKSSLDDEVGHIGNQVLYEMFYETLQVMKDATYRDLRDILLSDLNKLTRALEIYLAEYVMKLDVSVIIPEIASMDIDHVLSFNYTNTYTQLYDNGERAVRYDYIHGRANVENKVETNNMVLGIDEYLSGESKDTEVEFIAFKKFYQRIFKGSRVDVKRWCEDIKKEAEYEKYGRKFMLEEQIKYELMKKTGNFFNWKYYESLARQYDAEYRRMHDKHQVYIYGHSLDVSDKDILRDLILNDNVNTTIFYHSKDGVEKKELGNKITNLNKVIGENELIKRTTGEPKNIRFRRQEDVVKKK